MASHVCPWWFAYTFDNPLRRLFHKPEMIFSPYLQGGMTAMDIGCGLGYFSIGMAKMVGEQGRVIAVDVQQKMLDILRKRAEKAGVSQLISTVRCAEQDLGVGEKVDFALSFWMAHETPNAGELLRQVHAILKQSGKLMLVEPKIHVSASEFKQTVAAAQAAGFTLIASPPISLSYTAVFAKQ